MKLEVTAMIAGAIPLFDWTGPPFLMFYLICLVAGGIWCWQRAGRALIPYEVPGELPVLEDPYEVAYLAAGAPRVTQMAVARLIQLDVVEWKKGFTGSRLIRKTADTPAGLKSIEERLWNHLERKGDKGLSVSELSSLLAAHYPPVAASLALRGLRPTADERRSAVMAAVWPVIVLLGIGVIKVVIGVSRDKPVLFLMGLIIVTLILIVVISGRIGRLTRTGEKMLEGLKEVHPADARLAGGMERGNLEAVSMSLGLFGPMALNRLPWFTGISDEMNQKLGGQAGAKGSEGGSSGCGGGGCGGGGCGSGGGGGCGGGCGGCGGS